MGRAGYAVSLGLVIEVVLMRMICLGWFLLILATSCQGAEVKDEKPLYYRSLGELFSGDCRTLAAAAASGDVKKISRLQESGLDANCTGYRGVTPLYWAIAARRTSHAGIEALLLAGADPNRPVYDGTPLIHFATMREEPWILQTVLQHGGDPNAVSDRGGETPLFSAETHAAVVALVEAGADINFTSRYNRRPLGALAGLRMYESAYYLLQRGADWQVKEFIDVTRNISGIWDTRGPDYPWYLKTVEFLREKGVDL